MRKQLTGIAVGLLIAAFGAAFAIVGWTEMEQVRPFDDGVTATAIVVGNVEGTVIVDGIARPDFAPVYEFDAVDGERHRIIDHATSARRPIATGSTVEVSYRADEPTSVRRIDVDRSWLWWFVAGGVPVAGLGALVVVGSLVGLVRRGAPRQPRRRSRASVA